MCDVLDPHRHPGSGSDDDLADLRQPLHAATGPHHVALAVAFDVVRAAADVVGFDRIGDLTERNSVPDQPGRVRLDEILLDIAADGVGAGHTWDRLHLRAYDPVLHGAQIDDTLQGIGVSLSLECKIGAVALPAGFAVVDWRRPSWRNVFD